MKKSLKGIALLFAAGAAILAFGCKTEGGVNPTDTDTAAPANVTGLKATARDSQVLLVWTDAGDSDIFGYEVTYSATENENGNASRAVEKMQADSLFVAPGAGGCYVSGLANGKSYTFTVKTMDTSGNKASGVLSEPVTPFAADANETMKIELSEQEKLTNTTLTITAAIKSSSAIKRVVYKLDGSINAAVLLSDKDALDATVDELDNSKWTFSVTGTDESMNGKVYTVAAIDNAGREETAQITISKFDFTGPANVTGLTKNFKNNSEIEFNWKNPLDNDFDHVEISYTTNDGTGDSDESEAVVIESGVQTYTFSQIDYSVQYYQFYIKTVDVLGNKRHTRITQGIKESIPEDFVVVNGITYTEKPELTPKSDIFVVGRYPLEIRKLYVCDHETTQPEWEKYMTYYGVEKPDERYSFKLSEDFGIGDDYPVYNICWYDVIIYCNLRSQAENLTPVYYMTINENKETDVSKWEAVENTYISKNDAGKYYISASRDTGTLKIAALDNATTGIKMDAEANGYRLPTEIEWEYIARGENKDSYIYSGSDTLNDVACKSGNKIKTKAPNSLGIYDMSGNAYELNYDWYTSNLAYNKSLTGPTFAANSRIIRGGGYENSASINPKVEIRKTLEPLWSGLTSNCTIGFRLVRNAE